MDNPLDPILEPLLTPMAHQATHHAHEPSSLPPSLLPSVVTEIDPSSTPPPPAPLDVMLSSCQPRHLAMLAWALGNQRAPKFTSGRRGSDGPLDPPPMIGMVHNALDKVARQAVGKCGAADLANIAWALAQQV